LSGLTKLSLRNRIVVALLTAIIALWGVISVGGLKQELIPSIEIPSAAVVTTYPGASPEVVDEQVSRGLENAISTLEGIESTRVTSSAGLSVIRVSFVFGTSTEQVAERLNNAVTSVTNNLPDGVTPRVLSGSFDSVPIIAIAVSSDSGDYEQLGVELEKIAPALFRKVEGVRDVVVSGAREKRVNLTLNQVALAQNGLSPRDITAALQANGLVLPVGTLSDAQGDVNLQIGTRVETLEQFRSLPLISATREPGDPVLTIGDVASVSYEDAPRTSIARTNGVESLAVAITKTPDGNSVTVSQGVEELIPELIADLGGGVTVTTIFDQAPFIEKSIEDLTVEGLLGLTFATIVILVFLLSLKSTVITAISIPTSLLITFIAISVADYSLNLLTLGALTIAIGRVVDDSIVVIENINRHLAYGGEKLSAIITAVREVAGAITASTIATAAVFLPIALVDGLTGELFRPFAFTTSVALLASLLVSLTIVPVLAYWFLKPPKAVMAAAHEPGFAEAQREREEVKERRSLLQRGYVPVLNGTRRHPWLTLSASVLILGFTVALLPQLKTNFIDGAGADSFTTRLNLPAGTSFDAQNAAAIEFEDKILAIDGVKTVQATVGSAADGRVAFGASASGVSVQVRLEEGATVELVQSQILGLSLESGAEITLTVGPGFGSSETIDIRVSAPDEERLSEGVAALQQSMRGVENVSSVTSSLAAAERVLEIEVDRIAAAEVGLSEAAVSGIVAGQLRPSALGTVNLEGKAVPVYISGTEPPKTVSEVEGLAIPTPAGLLRLSQLANVEEVLKPTSITSRLGERTATVALTPEGDDLGAVTSAVTQRLNDTQLPPGVTATIGGAAADQAESFEQLGLALLAAIAIVYLVMVATFGSLIQPLILLISVPFAATGALGLLLITDTALGVPALIGMLMLIGIVVTNAIVLIDLVNQYRRQGRSVEDALINGSRQRLRPILMTAFATIFALTPMALGLTGGSGFISQPLAIVVIGGLFSSTFLTLILVPVLYWLIEGRTERKQERLVRRERALQLKSAANAKHAEV
jgi:hydrophobic/amphiphilic exporter-1 (mainly G- bacteria), HAE1 family